MLARASDSVFIRLGVVASRKFRQASMIVVASTVGFVSICATLIASRSAAAPAALCTISACASTLAAVGVISMHSATNLFASSGGMMEPSAPAAMTQSNGFPLK